MRRDDISAVAERLRQTVDRVDVLINNAGAAFPHYAETADGVERTHAVNHLAPFHLTHLLLDSGLLAPDARVINISSDLVTRGRIAADAPDVTGVSWRDVCSANPGVIRTKFNAKSGGLLKAVAAVSGLFAASPGKAARTPVLLATAPTPPEPTGGFFVKGAATALPEAARDPALATKVYEHTMRALGLA